MANYHSVIVDIHLQIKVSKLNEVTCTHLVRCSASREEVAVVIAMYRQVKDVGVVVESLLGAVAVVNILQSDSKHTITPCSVAFKMYDIL